MVGGGHPGVVEGLAEGACRTSFEEMFAHESVVSVDFLTTREEEIVCQAGGLVRGGGFGWCRGGVVGGRGDGYSSLSMLSGSW